STANTATSTMPNSAPPSWSSRRRARTSGARLRVPDARIQVRVQDVDEQIDHDKARRHDQCRALHERYVAQSDAAVQLESDTRPGKDCFGNDRAAEQRPHLQTDDSQYRQQRILQRVTPNEQSFVQALGARYEYVLLGKDFEERRTCHT